MLLLNHREKVMDVDVDGNLSENKEEENIEFECVETQPNTLNTALILNIFEILPEMAFTDDDFCNDYEDQRIDCFLKYFSYSSVKEPHH